MDAFGLQLGILSTVFSANKGLLELLQSYRDAPVAVIELANELRSFQALLRTLSTQLQEDTTIVRELRYAAATLEKIRAIAERNVGSSKQVSRIKWALKDREKTNRLRQELNGHVSKLGLLFSVETLKRQAQVGNNDTPEIIIAVMGITGAGKSHFIHEVTGSMDVKVGHTLHSETQNVQAHSINIEDHIITLIDTPGFDDTARTDVEVLEEVASWLQDTYKMQKLLSGILYLYPITSNRFGGSAVRNLDIFTHLIGPDSFHNIQLITTMWDLLHDVSTGEEREQQLKEHFWKPLIKKGGTTGRYYGSRSSALTILRRIAFDQEMAPTHGAPLTIQKELVDEEKTLIETSAGGALFRKIDELERLHEIELQKINEFFKEERTKMQLQIDNLKAEQAKLKQAQTSHHERIKGDFKTNSKSYSNTNLRINVDELLGAESPPPYKPKVSSTVEEATELSGPLDTHPFKLGIWLSLRRLFQPKLQKGYSRVEWICSCGDLLFCDLIEKSDGSLQFLARQLGGKVTSGPAAETPSFNTPEALPREPPLAYTTAQSDHPIPPGYSNWYDSYRQHDASGREPEEEIRIRNRYQREQRPEMQKWLELCIRSGRNTYFLGEINVTDHQSDQSVFNAIKEKYNEYKPGANRFLSSRIPNGGIFVQFRKDRLAIKPGDRATVSVMKQSVPKKDDEEIESYEFAPKPMDEPPIDSNTFNHYFHKPHLSDMDKIWTTRFPILRGVSFYNYAPKLAKGWGVEIIEEPNWMFFIIANLIGLLLSGLIAGLCSHFMGDNQTGVAIGAWLSAVQTLMNTASFWHRTNQ